MKAQSRTVQTTWILLTCWAMMAQATPIYVCDENGTLVYTAQASHGCHAADLPSIGRYSSIRDDVSALKPASRQLARHAVAQTEKRKTIAQTQSATKIVQASTNALPPLPKFSGSGHRRMILEQELSNERKALSEAQHALAQARVAKDGAVDRMQVNQLQSSVLDHQQNIQALQRELSRM